MSHAAAKEHTVGGFQCGKGCGCCVPRTGLLNIPGLSKSYLCDFSTSLLSVLALVLDMEGTISVLMLAVDVQRCFQFKLLLC